MLRDLFKIVGIRDFPFYRGLKEYNGYLRSTVSDMKGVFMMGREKKEKTEEKHCVVRRCLG